MIERLIATEVAEALIRGLRAAVGAEHISHISYNRRGEIDAAITFPPYDSALALPPASHRHKRANAETEDRHVGISAETSSCGSRYPASTSL